MRSAPNHEQTPNNLQDFEALKDPAKGQTFPSDSSPHHEAIARTVATATASVAMAVNGQAIATRLGLCVFFLKWGYPQMIQVRQLSVETYGLGDPPF